MGLPVKARFVKTKRSGTGTTAPSLEVLSHIRSMLTKSQRPAVPTGLPVLREDGKERPQSYDAHAEVEQGW